MVTGNRLEDESKNVRRYGSVYPIRPCRSQDHNSFSLSMTITHTASVGNFTKADKQLKLRRV